MPKQQVPSFLRDTRWLSSSSSSVYAESQTTQYDGYQQAWRLLGYFVDCHQQNDGDNENEDENGGDNSCKRYLLWGAYVDPNYNGGGVHEYQYYRNDQYDKTACANNSRCAKMDCHEKHSKFQLLGVFKQAYYASEWFPTLLEHQCVLDETTYETINEQEVQWPEGCTNTGEFGRLENGAVVQLYLDLQSSVNLQLTLYVDNSCKNEYTGGDHVSIDRLASTLGLPSREQEMQWNKALEPFYYCQPCMAIDLSNGHGRHLEEEEENVQFACYDNAGEVGVNQCAAFRENTQMEAASWHDLDIAAKQGGLAKITLGGETFGVSLSEVSSSSRSSLSKHASSGLLGLVFGGTFFLLSAAFLMVTINWKYAKRRQRAIEQRRVLAEPLVAKNSPPRIKTTASF